MTPVASANNTNGQRQLPLDNNAPQNNPAQSDTSGVVDNNSYPFQWTQGRVNDVVNDLSSLSQGTQPPNPSCSQSQKTKGNLNGGADGTKGSSVTRTKESECTTKGGNSAKTKTSTTAGGSYNPATHTGTVKVGKTFGADIKNSKGYGITFETGSKASLTSGIQTQNGFTTYSASSDVSVSAKAGVTTPAAGASYGKFYGVKASYEVKMPKPPARSASIPLIPPARPKEQLSP